MHGRRWEVGTDERPTMGGWDRWTTGKRGEIPGEDGVRAARGQGREFSASTKPAPVCVGFRPEILSETHAHRRGVGWSGRKPRSGQELTFTFGYQNVTDPAVHLSVLISKRHRSGREHTQED
jgi:hypothetical protein